MKKSAEIRTTRPCFGAVIWFQAYDLDTKYRSVVDVCVQAAPNTHTRVINGWGSKKGE